MVEIIIGLTNEKGEILVEIQDGKLTIPNITIIKAEGRRDLFGIWDYLNKFWGIDASLSFPRDCYIVLKNNIESRVIVIPKESWKRVDNFNLSSKYFIGLHEFQNLCDKKVVAGGWGGKECMIGLGAYYLQGANKEIKNLAMAKLVSIIIMPEKNISTI